MVDTTMPGNFDFVFLTDTHVIADRRLPSADKDRDLDTAVSLRRTLDMVRALEPQPAFIVVGGDLATPDLLAPEREWLAEDYEPSYRKLRDELSVLSCPVHLIMGNHDNRSAFHRIMRAGKATPKKTHFYSFDHAGYHFVALDSLETDQKWGRIEPEQLDWLRADLSAHSHLPTLIFVHHPPWDIGLKWLDDMKMRNGDDFIEVVGGFSQVRWIMCGHVHLEHMVQRGGLTMLTTPSTCFQVSKYSQSFELSAEPPAFRIVHVRGHHLSTRVMPIYEPNEP